MPLYLQTLVGTPQKISIYLSIEDVFFLNHVNTADFILIAFLYFSEAMGKDKLFERETIPQYIGTIILNMNMMLK